MSTRLTLVQVWPGNKVRGRIRGAAGQLLFTVPVSFTALIKAHRLELLYDSALLSLPASVVVPSPSTWEPRGRLEES